MKKHPTKTTTGLLMALAVAGLTAGCATSPAGRTAPTDAPENAMRTHRAEGSETVNEEIKTLIETYQRSLNEGDVALVKSVYTDDALFIGQPFPTANGRDAIVALYADFLSKLAFNVAFEILEVEVRDDLGYVRTQSVGTITPKGQVPEGRESNREIFILKRIGGAWKIHRYIFNPDV